MLPRPEARVCVDAPPIVASRSLTCPCSAARRSASARRRVGFGFGFGRRHDPPDEQALSAERHADSNGSIEPRRLPAREMHRTARAPAVRGERERGGPARRLGPTSRAAARRAFEGAR
ncbi:hypothetical protein X992_5656 [Burkholderia pseudomallei MSHR5492]|nr:hypothetical protein X992_5656 [Burkholderia pseudomallei MSHR5492]